MTIQADISPGNSTEKSGYQFGTWYPIGEAKKDGTEYLMHVPGFGMGDMVLYWARGYWREKANCLGLKQEPSHFMPLPPPPSNVDRSEDAKSDDVSMKP